MNKLLTISGVFINAFNPSYKWARGEGGSDKWGGRCLVSRITARHKLRSRKTVIPYQRVGKTEKSSWIYHRCLLTRLNRACSSTREAEMGVMSSVWSRSNEFEYRWARRKLLVHWIQRINYLSQERKMKKLFRGYF